MAITDPIAGTCAICERGCRRTQTMCDRRSYDRTAHRDGTVMEALVWAANRARRFERRRVRELRGKDLL